MRSVGGFGAGSVEIGMETIEHDHGHLSAPTLQFLFFEMPVQADGVGQVFGEGEMILPFANQNVADLAPCIEVVQVTRGVAGTINKSQQNFAMFRIISEE